MKRIVLVFLFLVAALYLWMQGIQRFFPPAEHIEGFLSVNKNFKQETNPWIEPWQRWDTLHYQAIAENGYSAFDTALFTPPIYPLLMTLFSRAFSGNTLAAGLFISFAFALGTVVTFYKLSREILGSEALAFQANLYLIFFPSAFFLIAAYAESAFLVCAMLCLYYAQKERWVLAGIFGGLAALIRSPGILLVIPLMYAAWVAWQKGKTWQGSLSVLITGGLSLLFPLYAWFSIRATPLDIVHAVGRGGYLTFPGLNILESVRRIFIGQLVAENLLELIFTLLFVLLIFPIWKKLPRIYAVYSVTMLIFLLSRMGHPQPLVSMARYVLEIFPAFMVLAIYGKHPILRRVIFYIFTTGLLFMSAQFALWGWVG
jgi:hypothetical protein